MILRFETWWLEAAIYRNRGGQKEELVSGQDDEPRLKLVVFVQPRGTFEDQSGATKDQWPLSEYKLCYLKGYV